MTITETPHLQANAQTSDDSVSTSSNSLSTGAGAQQTFLQLLVAQLKNQDPMNPADGMQFVAELAQFSQLEQIIGIHQDLDTLVKAATGQ